MEKNNKNGKLITKEKLSKLGNSLLAIVIWGFGILLGYLFYFLFYSTSSTIYGITFGIIIGFVIYFLFGEMLSQTLTLFDDADKFLFTPPLILIFKYIWGRIPDK